MLGVLPLEDLQGVELDAEAEGPAVQLLEQASIKEGGRYIMMFGKSPLEAQVCTSQDRIVTVAY